MISKTNNFIFIHIKKSAGNSLTERLLQYCEDKKKTKIDKFDGLESVELENSYGLKKHATCQDWVDKIGAATFSDYFVFTVIRNPWDRMISHFIHQRKWKFNTDDFDPLKFEEWLEAIPTAEQYIFYANPKTTVFFKQPALPGINYYLRFENLADDWQTLCNLLGLAHQPLEHRNRGDHLDYRTYYTEKSYQKVWNRCRWEIEFFQYRF